MKTYEEAIISETERLVENIKKLNGLVERVNNQEVTHTIEVLRQVEQKISLVDTFFRSSMYKNKLHENEEILTNRPSFKDLPNNTSS
ncbi:hypothetical protein BD408DRAFT_410032 [Parasitella parasitica]|nr:hypothetical protein BD408DRAFT_410032 [Parasitella parasitica]